MAPSSFSGAENSGWRALIDQAAGARRREADAACAEAIRAPSFTALVLGLAAWTETGCDNESLVGDKSLRRKFSKIAPALLDRLSRKVRKRWRVLATNAPPEALHPLRKSAKKLRYGVEFVTSLYPRKDVKRFVKPLKALQKSLGVINDAAMAARRGEELARSGCLQLDVPVGLLASGRMKTSRAARRKLDRQWARYEGQSAFWR